MVRYRKRLTDRGMIPAEVMKRAVAEVTTNNRAVNTVAKEYGSLLIE